MHSSTFFPPGFVPAQVSIPAAVLSGNEPDMFEGYAGPPAVEWPYVAWLGSIGGTKETFHVHVWKVLEDGTVDIILLDKPPPTNHSEFFFMDGKLMLMGVQGKDPDVWFIADWPSVPAPTIDAALAAVLEKLKRPGTAIRNEAVQISKEQTYRILRLMDLIP